MKYIMETYDYKLDYPICRERFTANDNFEAYLMAIKLFSEVRFLYTYIKVYCEYISDENYICTITDYGDDFNQ